MHYSEAKQRRMCVPRLERGEILHVRLLRERTPGNHTPDECGGGPLCVNALTRKLGVTQSAVSQHLRILRQAGLVRGERRGAFVHYSLDPDGLDKYRAALREVLGEGFVTGLQLKFTPDSSF